MDDKRLTTEEERVLTEQFLEGLKAKEILKDFNDFLSDYERILFNKWRDSDQEWWFEIKIKLDFLREIKSLLENIKTMGEISEEQLKNLKSEED